MSPLERVIDIKDIARIRIECGTCHTTVAFTVAGFHSQSLGDRCPFCKTPMELVERVVISLNHMLDDAKDIKGHKISLELGDAF